jgi:putative DNA primase/helicase
MNSRQLVLVADPALVDRYAKLANGWDVYYSNGALPPEAKEYSDGLALCADPAWCEAQCGLLAALAFKRNRWNTADLSQCTNFTETVAALTATGFHEYTSSGPQTTQADVPPVPTSEPAVPEPPESPPEAQNGPQDAPIPDWHSQMPPEGAEAPSAPFKARKKRPHLAAVDGNLARAPDPEHEPMPAKLSDDSLADHFADTYGQNWRYCTELGDWMEWQGDGWHTDRRNAVTDVCKMITREALQWADARILTPDGKRKINSKSTIWHVRDLAGADRRISIEAAELDADPWLLGVPGGVVDLRTGKLMDAEREQYITRRCSVAPIEGPHPLFDMVLGRACAGHEGMREYLLRWFGYFLTGDVREEAFIFLHGPGGSGKSTLIKVLTEIIGEYAVSISMDAFMEQKHPRHSQEIAKLAGMRMVYASETEEGRRWNEALIKDLTGRDTITAHKMRMDDFSFKPTFKLLLYGNSVPHLKSVGEEIRRRIHLVEYGASLAQEDRDTSLKDRLIAEYPAILASLIKGCVDWQDCGGLGKPESVNLSVDEYLEGEDSLAGFIAECIEPAPQGRETTGAVYRRFKSWAASTGEYAGSQKRLVTALRQRGYEPQKSGNARFITGIKLRSIPSEDQPPHWQRD